MFGLGGVRPFALKLGEAVGVDPVRLWMPRSLKGFPAIAWERSQVRRSQSEFV